MTLNGWLLVILTWIILAFGGYVVYVFSDSDSKRVIAIIVAVVLLLCAGVYGIGRWYFTSTASGVRAMVDQKSDLTNGLERTITVYTADGNVIAEYMGKIDIEADSSYVKFDYDGKRYIYYNCLVETIAEIP